jgi:hypothetical protein
VTVSVGGGVLVGGREVGVSVGGRVGVGKADSKTTASSVASPVEAPSWPESPDRPNIAKSPLPDSLCPKDQTPPTQTKHKRAATTTPGIKKRGKAGRRPSPGDTAGLSFLAAAEAVSIFVSLLIGIGADFSFSSGGRSALASSGLTSGLGAPATVWSASVVLAIFSSSLGTGVETA